MATRLPASQHTREELTALIEGRLSTASAKDELVKLDPPDRRLRAWCAAGSGLPEWVSPRTAENGRGADGIFGAPDCRAQ